MPKTIQAVEQAANLKIYTPQLDKLEERFLEWLEQDRFQACVIRAMRYGVPIFEGCYGVSTNDSGVKMDTIFPVASNTKPVIATLLMILQEEGRIEMGSPVKKYLPEYDGGGRENIQLWHFLTHTSGVGSENIHQLIEEYVKNKLGIERPGDDSTDEDWDKYNLKLKQTLKLPEDYDNRKVWDILSLRIELMNEPRKVMAYCSYGYQKLKEVICAVTGESIDSYAQRVLFKPLGMVDSHWVLPKEKWGRVIGRGEKCIHSDWLNSEGCYTSESGGGGLKTTVNDMTRFCEMILGEGRYNDKRILSPASVREMTSNYNSNFTNSWDAWGLGWNYRGKKVDDAGVLRSAHAVDHGGAAGHRIFVDRAYGLSVITYAAEYDVPNEFWNWGKIHNVIIASCE